MNVLIKGADVLTMESASPALRSADIAIVGNSLAAVGAAPEGFVADEVIDARDHLALPGFFNAHTHAAMSLQRGWAEDLPLDRWFNERIWVAESALTEDDVYWGTALAACEMIRGGTVAFADHYFWMDRVAQVVRDSGMKALLAWCVFGLRESQEIGGTTLERTAAFVRQWNGAADGRIRTVLGPHSPYICPPDFLTRVAAESQRLGVGCHLHVAESAEQVRQSLQQHGQTPVELLARLGLFDLPALAAHCLYVSSSDIAILAEKGVSVAHCAKTYMKLAMGVAPVLDMLRQGVRVAIGTDGAASSNSVDMIESMRLAVLVQKLWGQHPEALPSAQALRLATEAGAAALGFSDSGVLAPGRRADLILVDMRKPHLAPRHDLAANLVHAAQPADVRHVFVDGRLLMRSGHLLTLDEERIRSEAEKRGLRLVGGRLNAVRHYQS